jgi:predicted amidohydrolase YtcJ
MEQSKEDIAMPRYMIERTFPNGLALSPNAEGKKAAEAVIAANAERGITWVHSYVTPDKKHTFCVYDGPSPEAIRQVAERNGLPVNKITEVRVLDPYLTV